MPEKRTWQCAGCDKTIELTYDDLADEGGNPFCPKCKDIMELLEEEVK